MDNNNWRRDQGTEANVDASDWRGTLSHGNRQRIVNKIMNTLKRHLPVSGQDGLHRLRKIAQKFEEKMFTSATSRSDYLRKILVKMVTFEAKFQGTIPPNQGGPSNNKPPHPEFKIQQTVANNWRSGIHEARKKIVKKVSQLGLSELQKIAARFEEDIFATATSEFDYLHKIFSKMLTTETKSEATLANSIPPNQGVDLNDPPNSDDSSD